MTIAEANELAFEYKKSEYNKLSPATNLVIFMSYEDYNELRHESIGSYNFDAQAVFNFDEFRPCGVLFSWSTSIKVGNIVYGRTDL